jgi:glycosyltransferase involved in cell wall biosynthesis
MKIAIVHDWLPVYGGAERVLEQMLHVFPGADLFSLIDALPENQRGFLRGKPVRTSFVQRLPFGRTHYRSYFPIMPFAVEQFDLSAYDLVISSSYSFAKGALTGPNQLHVCFCHSPIRYAWDMQHQYLKHGAGRSAWIARLLLHYVRLWDARTAHGVDRFIANSKYIARRIEKVYRRDSRVIYPPVDVDAFSVCHDKEDFYVTASRLVPYKRIDLIVEAFAAMPDKKLVVLGDGPELKKLRAKATPNVTMLGHQPFDVLVDHIQRAKAFIFAAEEDFGIAPVEAQACGTPVIAFGRGGAVETIVDGETGIFFSEQTAASICRAVREFEMVEEDLDPERIRENAERFSTARFRAKFKDYVLGEFRAFATRGHSVPAHAPHVFAEKMLVEVS